MDPQRILIGGYVDLGFRRASVSTGFASGAVLGGLLVQESWRLVFFVNAPIGVFLLACHRKATHEHGFLQHAGGIP